VAFYLPQFHPIPENDDWWGAGFTEWTNVARARPLFPGHDQPHIPADLGFYDLRVPEVRAAQAELAGCHGIEAFCYWRYWFNGRQVLQRPFQEVLSSGQPRLGFCLAWANENWTGIWAGDSSRVLIEQTYPGRDDYARHFLDVLPAFRDERYFRVNGRPLFFVHRPQRLPDPRAFTEQWREMAEQHGLDGLYFAAEAVSSWRPVEHGFDAEVRTPLAFLTERPWLAQKLTAVSRTLRRGPLFYPYRVLANHPRPTAQSPRPELPMVLPNWDNTPRAGRRGVVLRGSTPDRFRQALSGAAGSVQSLPPDERIIFLKSWNEWAEGNYLEPDLRHGDRYLQAVSEVVLQQDPRSSIPLGPRDGTDGSGPSRALVDEGTGC